ncbi:MULTISPECIES: gluconate 2-dehydrogenase subunit 3 family protein [unclassified Inquilinus]|uniref:gluconate 2-dehydrogenase subunit 3 family protein n=1 Tax=unclassified Inquilinus TaxID=2645927 RepID=UPI003F8E7C54
MSVTVRLGVTRRGLLSSTAALLLTASTIQARTIGGGLPWAPDAGNPPTPIWPAPWAAFTPEEATAVEAAIERLIPNDALGPGAREASCAIFIDRQLAGSYGSSERLYVRPPFAEGTPQQGLQSPLTPAARYRVALAALDTYCRTAYVGRIFARLGPEERDLVLQGLERGTVRLDGTDGQAFFEMLLQNTMEGFFADPIHGGNRDMIGWKLVGFPGARYDYRDHVTKHNQPYPLPPVSITGRAEWVQPRR